MPTKVKRSKRSAKTKRSYRVKKSKKSKRSCKSLLNKKISINMSEYKRGRFKSPGQAIAVSYAQVKSKNPRCKKTLSRSGKKVKKSKRSKRSKR